MSWDPVWEQVFRSREWGKYPPEELVRFTARNFYRAPDRAQVKILELGCGPGANLWYLTREGFDVSGMDAAPTALEKARQRLAAEGLSAKMHLGDIAELDRQLGAETFDAIIDVACLQCNRLAVVESILRQACDRLKPNGRIFSMMVAAGTWGDGLGEQVEPGTYTGVVEGPLFGAGLNHFFTTADVERVFAPFTDVKVEYSIRSFGSEGKIHKAWVIEAARSG
jgi:SAM-dependent methyltransferase